ncbi:MAG: MFS transporter [Gaiellales bacterium]
MSSGDVRSQGTDPYRWVILGVGVLAQGSFASVFFGLPVLAPDLQDAYHLSLSQVGVALTSLNLGTLVTVLAWGLLSDRVGERAVISTGQGAAASLVGAALTSSFAALVLALFAAGAFGACVQAASGRAVVGWFRPDQRGLALGIRQTAVPVGGAIVALALPPLAGADGVSAGFLALAAGSLASAVAGALWMRDAAEQPVSAAQSAAHPFRDVRLWRLCGGSGLLFVAQSWVVGFVVLFLHQERGFSTGQSAGVLALVQVLGAMLRIGSGRWSDRVGARMGPLLRLGFALSLSLAMAAALLQAPDALLIPVLVVAGGLSLSWNALSFTATAELAGHARAGAALGLQQTVLSLSAALTPVAFAATVAATSWTAGFALAAASALLGTLVLRSLAFERGQPAAA